MATDTTVNNLIINKLTKAQYDAIASPSETELYLVPDEVDSTPTSGSDNPVSSGGVYSALGNKQDVIDSSHKLSADLITDGSTNKVINVKPDWNAASGNAAEILNKPTIPTVPTNISAFTNDAGYLTSHQSLSGYATETWVGNQGYLTSHQDISGKENTSNKVTSLSSSSTDTQYPSAKCVYDLIGDIQSALTAILGGNSAVLFSFVIVSTTYQAEEGMTWGDWVTSEYNTDGFYIGSYDLVYNNLDMIVEDDDGEEVTASSVITNQNYWI